MVPRYPPGAGGPASADYRTYLAYRWLDVDGDGLPDLVAAVHGDIDAYDIERGNRVNYSGGEPGISGIPAAGQLAGLSRSGRSLQGLWRLPQRFTDVLEWRLHDGSGMSSTSA